MKGDGFNLVLKNCDYDITNKPKELRRILDKLVEITGLNKLGKGDIQKGSNKVPGYSITQIIETSHIAIHGFSKDSSYIITIVSCEEFDVEYCIDCIKEDFGPTTYSINTFKVM